MYRSFTNYFHHLFHKNPKRWRPLLAVFYLTYSCDFRCPYCCDGHGTPYYNIQSGHLSSKSIVKLLTTVRRYCDYLVITGGEPLKHPQFAEVIKHVKPIGFKGVILTTNGYEVEKHIDVISKSVDQLVFSIDTLDHVKADTFFGNGPGTLKKILANIDLATAQSKGNYEIIISSVVTTKNLNDLYDVFSYAAQRGFRYAASPQLIGVKPDPAFLNNIDYQQFFNDLIESKKSGIAINGGVQYLQYMRDLKMFSCRPSTMLALSPMGDVFYPCLEKGYKAGNLLKTPDLNLIRKNGRKQFGPEPDCDNRCHSPCALGFSVLLNHPLSLLSDSYYWSKSKWKTGLLAKSFIQ